MDIEDRTSMYKLFYNLCLMFLNKIAVPDGRRNIFINLREIELKKLSRCANKIFPYLRAKDSIVGIIFSDLGPDCRRHT